MAVAVLPATALAASPPKVQIEPAEQTPAGFRLKAKVNPEGSATTYYFIYKQASAVECEDLEGCGPETPKGGPLAGDTQQQVQAEVTGLTPGTNYVYWLIARNANPEAVRSRELAFTTPLPSSPAIESTSVWNLTPTDATVGAEINPEGLPHGVYYQFQVVTNTSEYLSEIACSENEIEPLEVDGCMGSRVPNALPIREVSGTTAKLVSLDLENAGMTLKPGTTYHYRVLAVKALESEDTLRWEPPAVVAPDQTFTTPPAATAPVVGSVSLSNLTSSDATLEAQIDTEGSATTYQFDMWSSCAHERCEYIRKIPLPSGSLLGSFVPQSVSLDLNSAGVTLNYGAEYGWGITATSAAGHTSVSGGVFEPPPPSMIEPLTTLTSPPSGTGQPAGSNANTSGQPAGSGASSSSSTPAVQSPDLLVAKTTKLKPLTGAQKLANALKLCAKKPKKQRASCRKQAHKRYGSTGKQASTSKK